MDPSDGDHHVIRRFVQRLHRLARSSGLAKYPVAITVVAEHVDSSVEQRRDRYFTTRGSAQ